MNIYNIFQILILGLMVVSAASAQEKPENHVIRNITGTVIGTDSVGNIISIRTNNA